MYQIQGELFESEFALYCECVGGRELDHAAYFSNSPLITVYC